MSPEMMPPAAPPADDTSPETPNAKRLSVPDFSYPKNGTAEEKAQAVVDCLFEIGEHLRFLRHAEQARLNRQEAHELKLTAHDSELRDLKTRVSKLELEVRVGKASAP